jgi:hemerythrin
MSPSAALAEVIADLNEDLDMQRLELLDRAEALVALARAGATPRLARDARDLLAAATRLFALEERALARAGAPSLVRHQAEHARFLAELDALAGDLVSGNATEIEHLVATRWPAAWFEAHAERTDENGAASRSDAARARRPGILPAAAR